MRARSCTVPSYSCVESEVDIAKDGVAFVIVSDMVDCYNGDNGREGSVVMDSCKDELVLVKGRTVQESKILIQFVFEEMIVSVLYFLNGNSRSSNTTCMETIIFCVDG